MKIKIICILFLLCSFTVFAQIPQTLDSLKVFLKTQKQDTTYVLALNDYAFFMVQEGKFDETNKTIAQIETLSKKLNFGTGFYKAENMRGVIEYTKQKPEKAMKHFLKCNEIILKYKLPNKIYQNSLNNVGIIYEQLGDRENATKYAMQLIDFQEKNNLNPLKTWPYDMIGSNLSFYGKYEEALKYHQKGLEIETRYKNEVNMAIGENRIGNLIESMGNPKAAKEHFQKALKLTEKANYKLLEAEVLINLGRMYRLEKGFNIAETYLLRSVKLSKELESVKTQLEASQGLGTIYLEQNKLDKAQFYFEESLKLSKEIEDPEFVYQANNDLVELYEKKGDFEKAFFFQKNAVAAKDSMFKLETAKNTEDLLRKYETEKKEQEIALLNAKNEKSSLQNKALIGGGMLLILLTGISVVFLINKNKLKRLEESQKLRNKIATDLHDEIGSTLSSIMLISDMAQKQEGGSQKMFTKINSDSKSVMESVDEIIWSISPMNDSLQGIILRLKEYAQPLAVSKNIKFEMKADAEIEKLNLDVEVRRNLYLIVKEAINNLMKYSEATEASVHFNKDKKNLLVKIVDNGKGFDNEQITTRNGLKNMQARAAEIKGNLKFETQKDAGSKLTLEIPMA
jgi:two-component system, NarL family, sensor histidine kinase UhpB